MELRPDIALLQDFNEMPKYIEHSGYLVHPESAVQKTGKLQKFKNAIFVRGSNSVRVTRIELPGQSPQIAAQLRRFAGNLIAVELKLEQGPQFKVICVYVPDWDLDRTGLNDSDLSAIRLKAKQRKIYLSDLLWAALWHNKPSAIDPWIIGGDFNLCETLDNGSSGNREALNRMKELGLVDCLRYAQGALTPTFYKPGETTPTQQDDYLFVTNTLLSGLVICCTGSRPRVFKDGINRLSDHLPIIADFKDVT